jgi:hypothetical protein
MTSRKLSRRDFAGLSTAAGAVVAGYSPLLGAAIRGATAPLTEFGYGDVKLYASLTSTHKQFRDPLWLVRALQADALPAACDPRLPLRG